MNASLAMTAPTTEGSTQQQFLTFTLGDEEYGVDIMRVREVKGWTHTTRLPGTPDHVRGVLNLRGSIIPIFDLRVRFCEGMTEPTDKHVVVILAVADRIVGILADTVSDILTVTHDQIQPPPSTGSVEKDHFISGLIAIDSRMVVLLTMEQLVDTHALDALALHSQHSHPSHTELSSHGEPA